MVILDNALKAREREGKPIKVAMIGAGFMARGTANQIINSVPGMRLVAIANRTLANARRAYNEAGVADADIRVIDDARGVEAAMAAGKYAISENAFSVCEAAGIDALVEITGAVEFGAHVTLRGIEHGKHFITMNAELDGTVGPLLKVYADKAGVILTGCDGDQPVVQMNLFRFVRSIGVTPLVCGNIKGLQDPYRNPTTQEGFAKKWGQDPWMVSGFADGTKMSFEQAIVANATGMCVEKRGMRGTNHPGHVDELTKAYDVEFLKRVGGVVDYTVGSKPNPAVFVLGTHDDPKHKHFLNLYKLGEGPLYSFYTPYHLCHFEAHHSIGRAVIFGDAALQPLAGPRVDVVATAKTDLKAGSVIDKFGGYMTYGQCENYSTSRRENLLPIGLAEGCTLTRDLKRDDVLTYADVKVPPGRLIDKLRAEQDAMFPVES